MPAYSSYLTDTDRAIDRDTNEMLSPRANNSGAGYIAQGYANMDVLPEQLALADMLQRRQSLSMHSRQGRREQRDENMAAAEQDEFDGYSDFVRGTAGMNESDRAAAIRDRALNNPSELNNTLINKSRVVMMGGDKAVLDAKQNALAAKQAEFGMLAQQYDIDTFDQQAKLKDEEFANERSKAALTRKQIEAANYQMDKGDVSKFGENIFTLNPFGDDKETRDKLIKTVALLPKETEEDRNSIRALSDIAGGLAIGRQVGQLKSYAALDHQDLIRSMQSNHKINLLNLPKDRVERDYFIKKAYDSLASKGGDIQSFTSYISKVKEYNEMEESVGQLTADFTESIGKLEQLSKSPDPNAKNELIAELALINAKASGQASYFHRAYEQDENQRKVREKNSELAKRDADINNRRRSTDATIRRDANREYSTAFRNNMAVARDEQSRLEWAQRLVEDGAQDTLGLSPEASVKDVMDYAKKMIPSAGVGSSTKDF